MSLPGQGLPGYTEINELGSGTQGRVVLARHDGNGLPVAIKYLTPGDQGGPHLLEMFRREAAAMMRVVNPHVVRLPDYAEGPNIAAIVMEAVSGRSLRAVLDEHEGPLAPEAALLTLKSSLLGLAAAHAVGVVHRDYKPGNVLVQDDGTSKLIDFGVAVLAGQAGVAGTPAYMAPEQWRGQPAAPATDIYAATCVFVECTLGRKPFAAPSLDELRLSHLQQPPPLDELPGALRPLVIRGMAKDPAQRISSANDLIAELERQAVREYGPDWERRGLITLGAAAALVSAAVPAALMASGGLLTAGGTSAAASAGSLTAAAGGHGATAASGLAHATPTAQTAAKLGTSTGKGVLSKVGGTKGAVAICGAGAAATITAVVVWPSGPKVGGESDGALTVAFSRPDVLLGQPNMPPSETPYMKLKFKISPARARTGTTVKFTMDFQARTPGGVRYLAGGQRKCLGEKATGKGANAAYNYYLGKEAPQTSKDDKISMVTVFKVSTTRKLSRLPTEDGTWVTVQRTLRNNAQPYVASECAYLSHWTEYRTFELGKADAKLRPGKYLVGPSNPPQVSRVSRNGIAISPSAVGAYVKGNLPTLNVLKD